MRQQDHPVVGCTSRCNYGTLDVGRVTHQDCSGFDCERCRCSLYGPPKSIMGDHYPAIALVEVKRLVEHSAKIEIEATAVVPE